MGDSTGRKEGRKEGGEVSTGRCGRKEGQYRKVQKKGSTGKKEGRMKVRRYGRKEHVPTVWTRDSLRFD